MSMHVLLTAAVTHYGGSRELIRLLNSYRLGAISSEDTHGRLVTFVSSQREKGIKKELSSSAFKIDNIDVLSHSATAYAGKKSNIWHGTSIQCVEPKVSSLFAKVGEPSSHSS